MGKIFSIFGAVYGMLGVILGAFGAHALAKMLTESNRLDTYHTAVKYQFIHALLLILIGILYRSNKTKSLKLSGITAILGVLIFSGSLYTICFTGINVFGAVAPIGGSLLVASWAFLTFHFYKNY
ncbi:Uncharacterized membrane protein YgdD, TMEM256/DUF423 family [Spirosomataceae bacterium TFI 002]|nr:Uncharacterized membrane protein YgdD, TMEM256/DUF423 family [Spirosomataceae bacterium TFI 002]